MTAEQHLTYWQSLCGLRATWDARWQTILEWCTPHKAYVNQQQTPGGPPTTPANRGFIHDTTAIESCNTLADYHMSNLVAPGTVWFKGEAPGELAKNDRINKWYGDCARKMLDLLVESNFYTSVYSVFRDRSGPGTGAMYIMRGKRGVLSFTYMPLGSYSVAENEEGDIDTLYREFELTCTEAIEKFGKEKVGEAINRCYEEAMKGDVNSMSKKFKFVHGVRPRQERDPQKIDALNMPFESVYILVQDKHLVEEGGFETFPFVVTRFEKWGSEPYGFSPAYNAMPNIRTANYLVRLLKALGELKVMPRTISLAGEKGQIDMRAGGNSKVSKEAAALNMPREWATAGDFELGQWLIEQERAIIRKFFHNDTFRTFSNLPADVLKDMTAEVARGLKTENLLLLAPSFSQWVTDFRPAMERMFSICYEAGAFDDPPEELLQATVKDGVAEIPAPTIVYISRIGLALKEIADQAADEVMDTTAKAAAYYPDIFDNYDLDVWIRQKGDVKGVDSSIKRPWDIVEKIRQDRAQKLQQEQAAIMAQQVADTAATASKADPAKLGQLATMAA